MRKRIGILLSQMEEKTQKSIMEAFTKEAYAHDYDLCVFSSHQKYQNNVLRNIGDNNIYSLVQFDKFDALLVLIDTILAPGVEEPLMERIHNEFKGPVIIVDKENSYYESVMMDHYEPLVKLTDHLLEVHQYTDIAFLGGKKGHPHSIQRMNGFLDSMKAHNVEVREDRIFHGDFWFDSGYTVADYLYEHKDDLPQAVVCANDYMAIGLAARLSDYGINIPDDIAIVGYDSVESGVLSPAPLTSAEIPAAKCGVICFHKLHSAITGESTQPEELETKIFIGGSCGCKDCKLTYVLQNRTEWKTEQSVSSFYSDLTHITEDMICQTDYDKFFNMLVRYSYQVRPFHRLWFCLNDGYDDAKSFIGDRSISHGYADKMHMVVKCGDDILAQDSVDRSRVFDTELMLPELYEERDYPTTFVFTPMFFEDRCFGYAVLNMGPEPCIYNKTFRVWMRSINQGMEAFYRQKAFYQMIEDMNAKQVRDSYTGLYNYKGFIGAVNELIQNSSDKEQSLGIIAIDLENMKGINAEHGRDSGDAVLLSFAKEISRSIGPKDVCGRLGNDEFLIGFVSDDCKKKLAELGQMVPKNGIPFAISEDKSINVKMAYAMIDEQIGKADPEYLINQSVNAKNYMKKLKSQKQQALERMTDEQADKVRKAEAILDGRGLSFHFQPIVSAKDGSVYGYEALMRDESEAHLSPFDILKAAGIMKRLYDVEEQTFNGVLDRVESAPWEFEGKKIFINSLPGYQLDESDAKKMMKRMTGHKGSVVIEYTEDSEVSAEVYYSHSEEYASLGIEVALDDYGSGYSNANNLMKYAPNYVKLDRGLISDIDKNPQKRYFVKSIIDYSKMNNISVLAEGVETQDELKTVINLGVELIQGYYTGRPVKQPIARIDSNIESQILMFNVQKEKTDILYKVQ